MDNLVTPNPVKHCRGNSSLPLAGSMPRKQLRMIVGWLAFHEEEAYRAWSLAVQGEHFGRIPPM